MNGLYDPLCGTGGVFTVDEMPIVPFHQFGAFGIGLDKTRGQVERASDSVSSLPPALVPSWDNAYLKKIRKDSLKRLKAKIGQDYKREIFETLKMGAEEGWHPLDIARRLHRRVGEGQMWYWNRLARSEVAIALDAAFVAEAKNDGVPFEKWSTTGNPCPICAPLDGKIWRVGEGPRVVYDTHPHCLCVKYVYLDVPGTLQPDFGSEWSYV